jgi:hypothetical protein
MDTVEWTIVVGFCALVLGVAVYAVVRLLQEPRSELDPRSQRLARLFLYPRFFDPLLAKALTRRELVGWLIVAIVMVGAIAFTLITGVGVRP